MLAIITKISTRAVEAEADRRNIYPTFGCNVGPNPQGCTLSEPEGVFRVTWIKPILSEMKSLRSSACAMPSIYSQLAIGLELESRPPSGPSP